MPSCRRMPRPARARSRLCCVWRKARCHCPSLGIATHTRQFRRTAVLHETRVPKVPVSPTLGSRRASIFRPSNWIGFWHDSAQRRSAVPYIAPLLRRARGRAPVGPQRPPAGPVVPSRRGTFRILIDSSPGSNPAADPSRSPLCDSGSRGRPFSRAGATAANSHTHARLPSDALSGRACHQHFQHR